MQSCSIRGCQSYKTIQTKPVAYFKFPFHSDSLLESWLSQINQDKFSPTSQDQICSTHFLIEDIEPSSIGRYPVLKPDAIPTVFPERKDDPEPVKGVRGIKPKITKSEIKPAMKNSPDVKQFETILIPDMPKSTGITLMPKQTIIQAKPAIIPQKIVQLANKPAIQTTQIISSPIQIQTRGIPIQTKPIQIQPKPIQIQKIQFHPNIQLQGKPQILHFQGKQFQIQQQSPIQIQQKSPIQFHQKSPIQFQQKSPISIQQQSPIMIPQNPMIQFQQSIQPNGKLIPLKQINPAELQEILAKSNNVQKAIVKKPSILKPNILSRKIVNANTSLTGSSPDNKRPILRIQINKLNDEGSKKLGSTSKENATKVIRTKPEEVQIKALNKSVIFRLEPSGQIVVETVETKDGVQKVVEKVQPQAVNRPVVQRPVVQRPVVQRPVVQTPVDVVKMPDPKLSNLKTLYNKAQEDCEKLSKKLASLKQRHSEEQEQILKLQGHLTGLDKKVEKSYDSDISGSSVSKKRKIVTQKEEEDEYEKLLREVRKIKADYDKNIFSKPTKKQLINIKAEAISLQNDARELENILTQDQTINTTVLKRDINRKKIESRKSLPVFNKISPQKKKVIMPEIKKSNVVERKKIQVPDRKPIVHKSDVCPSKSDGEIIGLIDEDNEDIQFSDDEMNFEAEYLDPEFINC